MAIWTQSGCANLHINICLQAGRRWRGEAGSGWGWEWGLGREELGGAGWRGPGAPSRQRGACSRGRGIRLGSASSAGDQGGTGSGLWPFLVPEVLRAMSGGTRGKGGCRSLSSERMLTLTAQSEGGRRDNWGTRRGPVHGNGHLWAEEGLRSAPDGPVPSWTRAHPPHPESWPPLSALCSGLLAPILHPRAQSHSSKFAGSTASQTFSPFVPVSTVTFVGLSVRFLC